MNDDIDICFYIKKINDAIIIHVNERLKRWDLTFSQLSVLIYLLEHDKECITQKDIEQHFHLKRPTVIGLLQRMEKSGFLKTVVNSDDRRCRDIILLEKAYEVYDTGIRERDVATEHLTHYLDEKDKKELIRLLDTLYNALLIANTDTP